MKLRLRSIGGWVLLLPGLAVLGCGSDDAAAGGAPSQGGGQTGGSLVPATHYAVTVVGRGTAYIEGERLYCEEGSCNFDADIVDPPPDGITISVPPDGTDWVLESIAIDGAVAQLGIDWSGIVVGIPGDHQVEVRFVELPPCTPSSQGAPSAYAPPEACAGQALRLFGSNLGNDAFGGPYGSCVYLRNELVAEGLIEGSPDVPTLDPSSNSTFLTIALPASYPTGPALFIDDTASGRLLGGFQIVADLPTPVVSSITPNPFHAGDTLTIKGSNLDHVAQIEFTCVSNCQFGPGEYVDVPVPIGNAEITLPVDDGLFMPGEQLSVSALTACGASNALSLTYQ